MKILHVISSMDPKSGGTSQGVRNSVTELLKLDVHNEVVCLNDPTSEFLKEDQFIIHAIGRAKGPWGFNANLVSWLENNISRFDTIIIHGLWLYHSFATHKVVQNYKKTQSKDLPKTYLMTHGMLDPWFQKANGRKLKAIRNWLYWKVIEGKIVNQVNGLLFTSDEELRLAKSTFEPYHPRKELNVGYGVMNPPNFTEDMTQSFASIYPDVQKSPYLLFLSRIDVKKGIDILIKGYIELKNVGYKLPKLVIAGPGADTHYGEEMVTLSKAEPDILFVGMLSGNKKWGAFYNADAFILPSHQENFGIAVVEALSCSVPVLISNQVNIFKEIEGQAGIVASDDLAGVKKLLIEWSDIDIAKKLKLRENAGRVYREHFTIEGATEKLLNSL